MIDPISLGIAAAALLASKFAEGFAKDAGSSSWRAVEGLRTAIAKKFGHANENPTALTVLAENPSQKDQAAAASLIAEAVRSDPYFAHEVETLVTTARQDKAVDSFVAVAFDKATQINIRGDNSAPINISLG